MHPIMHLRIIACLQFRPQRCATVSSERRLRLAWGAATLGGDILLFCSGVDRARWDSHGLEAQFVDRGVLSVLSSQLDWTPRLQP